MLVERHLETPGVVRLPHGLQPPGHALGVAVHAAGADPGAPSHGVPGGFRCFVLLEDGPGDSGTGFIPGIQYVPVRPPW